jgi:tRNA-dihydrouridine synthase
VKYYFAPMEGITDYIFRNIHHRYFPGADKYFTPFFSPTCDGRFPPRNMRDFDLEANKNVPVVPQLLTKHGADFLWAAKVLADLGYSEINLNLGCPSGTVTAKGKGSGLLSDLEGLTQLLDEIYVDPPAEISIKTRLGRKDPEEFPRLMEIFNRYPISELTVHCRVGADFYRKPARPEAFALPMAKSRNLVCYNGDLTTQERIMEFQKEYPEAPALMLGRGAVADPALIRRVKGGEAADRETLRKYTEELYERYSSAFGSPKSALGRMKEIWFYQINLFEGAEKYEKGLKKAASPQEYRDLAARIFGELPLRSEGAKPPW